MIAAVMLTALLAPAPVPAPSGERLYTTYCASCHRADKSGSANAPPLRNVGMASLDFWMQTGRMPAAVPWLEVGHRDERSGQALPAREIAAIESYLAPTVGAPAIPAVSANGDVRHGEHLYALHCEHCHGVRGDGGAIGGVAWAPDLHHAAITQVAEAIRVGPGQMPKFGDRLIPQRDLDDIAHYVTSFRNDATAMVPLRSSGPVPEGAMGWVATIALVLFVFAYWRSDTPPADRADTVRLDAPEQPPTGPTKETND